MKRKSILPFISFCVLSVACLNSCGSELNDQEQKSLSIKSVNSKDEVRVQKNAESSNKNINNKLAERPAPRFQNVIYADNQPQNSRMGKMPGNNSARPANNPDQKLNNKNTSGKPDEINTAVLTTEMSEEQEPKDLNKNAQMQPNNQSSRIFGMSVGPETKTVNSFGRSEKNKETSQNKKVGNEQIILDAELEKELQDLMNEAAEKQKQIIAKYPKVQKQVNDKKLQIFVLCRYVQ